jgi:hypothetical protein
LGNARVVILKKSGSYRLLMENKGVIVDWFSYVYVSI